MSGAWSLGLRVSGPAGEAVIIQDSQHLPLVSAARLDPSLGKGAYCYELAPC